MADEQGDTAAVDFDDPSLTWGDEPEATDAAPPPATDEDTAEAAPDADSTPEPAREVPVEERPEAGDRQPQGPIPFDRHEAILAKAREETAAANAKWERVAWAEELQSAGKSAAQVQEAMRLFDGINQDPVGFLERFHSRLQEHPQLAQPLKSWAGRVLASRQQAASNGAPEAGDPEPQPDFQNEAGVPFYSGPQLQKWQQWQTRQQDARLQQMLGPLQEAHTQARQQEALRIVEQQQTARTQAELERLRQIPAFKANEAKVHAVLKQHQYQIPLVQAWNQVLVESLSGADQAGRKAQLAELQQKAGASTVSPSATAVTTPKRPRDFDDPDLEW